MRTYLLLLAAAGCTTSAADPAPKAAPSPAPPPPAQIVKPLELAGPFASLQDSCKAAPPCGFTDMDPTTFKETVPPKVPDCSAVLDPSIDRVRMIPMSISTKGGDAAMTHKTSDGEIRIGGVICAVPDGLRREEGEYYVFVHRYEGWYRTKKPMFDYSYNDKYCSGGMYILWNDKPSRTIAGIAAAGSCLRCSKQGSAESIAELMLRVEMTGKTPAVYPFVPVGHRKQLDVFSGPGDPTDTDCVASKSAMSLAETWPADDDVILTGKTGPTIVGIDGLHVHSLVGDGTVRPGHFHFER